MEKKIDYHEHEFGEELDNLNASSASDCTGAVPVAIQSNEERHAYKEVYNFEPPYVEKKED